MVVLLYATAPDSNLFTSRQLNYSAYMPDHVQTRGWESVTSYSVTLYIVIVYLRLVC